MEHCNRFSRSLRGVARLRGGHYVIQRDFNSVKIPSWDLLRILTYNNNNNSSLCLFHLPSCDSQSLLRLYWLSVGSPLFANVLAYIGQHLL